MGDLNDLTPKKRGRELKAQSALNREIFPLAATKKRSNSLMAPEQIDSMTERLDISPSEANKIDVRYEDIEKDVVD